MYHRIAPLPAGTTVPNHYVHPARFRRHVTALAKTGHTAVSTAQVLAAFNGGPGLPAKPVVFTFDDGYAHWAQDVVPVLAAQGWPGTLFIVSGLLGGHNDWDNRNGDVREPLMSAAEVVAADRAGMEIGGHSVTHARLPNLNDDDLRSELTRCRETLEALVGHEVRSFCYPYGAVDRRVRDAAEQAGYVCATTVAKGLNDSQTDRMLWRRINVRRDTSTPVLFWKLMRERLRSTAR